MCRLYTHFYAHVDCVEDTETITVSTGRFFVSGVKLWGRWSFLRDKHRLRLLGR